MTSKAKANYPVPDKVQIERLWEHWGMLPNIRAHSLQVCQVALRLGQWLEEHSYHLNKDIIEAGALLHDVAKAYCLDKPDLRHGFKGQQILCALGYSELGELVARHVDVPGNYQLDESVIVFYADKRVIGDKVVSLDERFKYILQVYGQDNLYRIWKIKRDALLAQKIENEIFSLLPSHYPQDLLHFNNQAKG